MQQASLFLILFVIYGPAFAQPKTGKAIGKEALTADLNLYKNILEKGHAGLYKYHSKEQVDSLFNRYSAQISDNTDLLTFFKYLSTILTYIGSLHDDISLPDSLLGNMVVQPAFFPYPIRVTDNKLLVNIDGVKIPAGAEILSINGQPTSRILPGLYKYYTTDGLNITGKIPGINKNFPLFYRYEYGASKKFLVVYKPFQQSKPLSITLNATTLKDYAVLSKKRHSLALDTLLQNKYDFTIIDSLHTAVLTVNTFDLGNAESKKHAAYKQFLQQCFATLKARNMQHLVVDIRKNGGGSDPNDLLTFSFLAHHPFKENKEAFSIFQQVPFKEYFTGDSSDIQDIEDNFHLEHNQLQNGRYYQNPSYNPFWQPDSLAFKGKLYLLISPAVASAASLFASMVKSEGYATVIGEESMGGYYGHTGHNSVDYQLPHTKIDFSFSVIDLLQYVTEKKEIPFGSGIIPDKIVTQTQKDFISNRDTILRFTLKLIAAGQ